jgi:DNA-binding response OmpR family regulator
MSHPHDQQPILRTVGRRASRDGQPLTPADRALLTQLAQYRTRAPKGVFIYYSAEEMDRDRLSWTVDAIVERQR